MNYQKHITGFTMAEVLITIGIIGVVAAMTFPSLVSHYRHKVFESQFKKYYSIFSQASSAAKLEFNDCNQIYAEDIKQFIFNKLNTVAKNTTETSTNLVLFPDEYRQYTLTGSIANTTLHQNCLIGNSNFVSSWGKNYQAILNDGSFVGICSHLSTQINNSVYEDGNTSTNGTFITRDVNGLKGPNRFGQDIWGFHLNNSTCVVEAAVTYSNFKPGEENYGSNSTNSELKKMCSLTDKSSDANGFYCAYYAIQDKCPDGSAKSYWDCLPK